MAKLSARGRHIIQRATGKHPNGEEIRIVLMSDGTSLIQFSTISNEKRQTTPWKNWTKSALIPNVREKSTDVDSWVEYVAYFLNNMFPDYILTFTAE